MAARWLLVQSCSTGTDAAAPSALFFVSFLLSSVPSLFRFGTRRFAMVTSSASPIRTSSRRCSRSWAQTCRPTTSPAPLTPRRRSESSCPSWSAAQRRSFAFVNAAAATCVQLMWDANAARHGTAAALLKTTHLEVPLSDRHAAANVPIADESAPPSPVLLFVLCR